MRAEISARPLAFLYPGAAPAFHAAVLDTLMTAGYGLASDPADAAVAIAPLLRTILAPSEWQAPERGTLICHPSLLPRHRGPDAVRQAIAQGDAFTGVTWFWCDHGLDAGAIGEQELVAIPAAVRIGLRTPGDFYRQTLVPAAIRSLRRVLAQLHVGYERRVPQDEAAATYESWLEKRATA